MVQMLLHAGIAGFLSKADTPAGIPQAVRQVTCGQLYISPRVANDLAIVRAAGATSRRFKETLSARDFDVLRLLGEGFTNVEIAAHLRIGKRTVREHVEKVCRVLDLEHAHQVIAWAAANGFGRPKTQ